MKHLLWWLFVVSRGSGTRVEIVRALKERPYNANQLAELLNVGYRTIRHHLKVLEDNGIIETEGSRYGIMYFLSSEMEQNYALFEDISKKREKNK